MTGVTWSGVPYGISSLGNKRDFYLPVIEKGIETQQSFEMEVQNISRLAVKLKWISWCAVYQQGKWYTSGRDVTLPEKDPGRTAAAFAGCK